MKKFFTAIPLTNPKTLQSYVYPPVNNEKLDYPEPHSFPILNALNGYVEPGDNVKIYALCTDLTTSNQNFETFEESVKKLWKEKFGNAEAQPTYEIEKISLANDESIQFMTDLFQELIDRTDDEDELFTCITYGTKPQSMILQMAMQYAYRIKQDVSVMLLYGKVTRVSGKDDMPQLFDMSGFMALDEIINLLAARKVSDPRDFIRTVLSL